MSRFKVICSLMLAFFFLQSIFCRDTTLGFKGAYFLPTNGTFRDNYKGSVLYGPELTVQLWNDKKWYGFASIDYFQKKGRFLHLSDSKRLKMLLLAIGLKYFVPISDRANFYIGLGFQPVYLRTKSRRVYITLKQTRWAFGGIGKIGLYTYLSHHFLLNLFFDYSFVKTSKTNFYGYTMLPSKANINGAIVGASLGYRF